MYLRLVLFFAFLLELYCGIGLADEPELKWGHLKGKISVAGDIPKLEPLIKAGDPQVRDAAVCAAQEIPDPSFLVDAKSRGIANAALYLKKSPNHVHPLLATVAAKEMELQVKGCSYEPHVMFVRVGQKIRLKSQDAAVHNAHIFSSRSARFCQIINPLDPAGEIHEMLSAEPTPVGVYCDIHPWMSARWLVLDHPYAAITGRDGTFEIKNLPVGVHEFSLWHERPGFVTPAANSKTYRVEVKPDETTQLDIIIPVERFFTAKEQNGQPNKKPS